MENVKNNMEKYYNYTAQIKKYRKAMELGFYYEAIFISYAMMEDRLMSFLDKAGVVTLKNVKLAKRSAPFVRYMLNKKSVVIRNITTKMEITEQLMKLTYEQAEALEKRYEEENKTNKMNGFLLDLYMDIDEKIDRQEVLKHFVSMRSWLDKRNALIHGLANKRSDNYFNDEVQKIAEESEAIWRFIDDNLVKKMRSSKLRKKYRIQ